MSKKNKETEDFLDESSENDEEEEFLDDGFEEEINSEKS
jgi:hypothetical protein